MTAFGNRIALFGLGCVLMVSCVSRLNSTETNLRNCVAQEATADGRLACINHVMPPEARSQRCSEARRVRGKIAYRPIDDKRRDDVVREATHLQQEAWNGIVRAPFVYEVDWGGVVAGADSSNAQEWVRGTLLGSDGKIELGMSPATRRLLQLAMHPDGFLKEDFISDASSALIGESAEDLRKVEGKVQGLRTNVHKLFSGLYSELDKLTATTICYRDFAKAEFRMQRAIDAFERKIVEARRRLEARHKARTSEEAELAERDRKAWAKANADTCRAARKATDCDGVDAYLVAFPEGAKAEEARQILASVASTLGPLRDDAMWAATSPACKTPNASTDCDGVNAYVKKYPQGRHAQDALVMLRLKRVALAQFAAAEEQGRRIAKLRVKQDCIKACVEKLRGCQKECRVGATESLVSCQKTCSSNFRQTCAPACGA